jgi:hypothetical protein
LVIGDDFAVCINQECEWDSDELESEPDQPSEADIMEMSEHEFEMSQDEFEEMLQPTVEETPVKKKKRKGKGWKSLPARFEPAFVDQMREHCKSNGVVIRRFIRDALEEAMNPTENVELLKARAQIEGLISDVKRMEDALEAETAKKKKGFWQKLGGN